MYILLEQIYSSNDNPDRLSDYDFMGVASNEEDAKVWMSHNSDYRTIKYCQNYHYKNTEEGYQMTKINNP